jgi:hypothetical protein
MDNNWKFYSKLFKYILEKYFNPKIERDEYCIKYKIIFDKYVFNYLYFPYTDDWCNLYIRYLSFKELKIECVFLAGFIGYKKL